jgi:hypothetical protein
MMPLDVLDVLSLEQGFSTWCSQAPQCSLIYSKIWLIQNSYNSKFRDNLKFELMSQGGNIHTNLPGYFKNLDNSQFKRKICLLVMIFILKHSLLNNVLEQDSQIFRNWSCETWVTDSSETGMGQQVAQFLDCYMMMSYWLYHLLFFLKCCDVCVLFVVIAKSLIQKYLTITDTS